MTCLNGKKNLKSQKEEEVTVDNYSIESHKTQSQLERNEKSEKKS